MRKQYEQICMDDVTMEQDPLEYLLRCTKTQQRVWKTLWDMRDANNQVATTQKELSEGLEISASHVSTALKFLVVNDMIQREGIHFYLNPHHWWYGEDHRKQTARIDWDNRKEISGTNNNK